MRTISRREFAVMGGGAAAVGGLLTCLPRPLRGAIREGAGEEVAGLTLVEASSRIHRRAVTSTQLTKAMLARIAVYDPKVNAYITVMESDALRQAAQLDEEAASGKFRGPLHGVPIALKDNIDTAGVRTTAASPMFRNRVPTEDAAVVTKLRAAGAVILGKLNLHEFALGCSGDVSYFGPARNPWNLELVTGGSSSGSAAAVSAELCYGALGTDTGGSIRVPSSWCGVVGLMPTMGLVSIRGIVPCLASLDHCGPMARTVEDVAMLLTALVGYDAEDIYSVEAPKQDYLAAMRLPVSNFRLGAPVEFYDHLQPEVAEVVAAAMADLRRLTKGVTSRAPLPSIPLGETFFNALGDTAAYHGPLIERSGMEYMAPSIADLKAIMTPATAAESSRAHARLAMVRRQVDDSFREIDLIVVPTTTSLPKPITASLKLEMGDRKPRKAYNFFDADSGCNNTVAFDVYGIPALTLPCGFTKSGLPVGLMIAGPHFAEGKVLALAYAYQQATQWHTRRPELTPETPVPPLVEAVNEEKEAPAP